MNNVSTTTISQSGLTLPSAHDTQMDVSSSPSPISRSTSITKSRQMTRIKLAKRIKQTPSIKKVKKMNKIKKIKSIKKSGSLRAMPKPSTVLTSVKFTRSSSGAITLLGKRTRQQSTNPSSKSQEEPVRAVKKSKHWTEDSSDSEDVSSTAVEQTRPVNIPGWIEDRKNEHREQVAPYPWGGSILQSRSPLHQSVSSTETPIPSYSEIAGQSLIVSTLCPLEKQFEMLSPTITGSTRITRWILEESKRQQQSFHIRVLLFILSLYSLFLLLS